MKALIIYKELASATEVNIALQHSAQNLNFAVQWSIRPWRMDMLKFPPSAEEALTDALDAHLIVFAGSGVQSFPFWLQNWLEHWAKNRQIEDAALAVFCEANADAPSMSAILELWQFATRHGLNLIFDDKTAISPPSIEDNPSFIEEHLNERDSITPQNLGTKTRDASQGWSIIE